MPIAAAIPLRRMLDSAFDSEPACSTMDCFTYMAAYQTSNPARHDSQKNSGQDIRWIVDVQIEPGERDQNRQDQRRYPEPAPACVKSGNGGEGGPGVAGWEGEIIRPGDEKLDSRIHITGTNARDQRLQHQITADNLQHKAGHDCHSDLSVLWHENEDLIFMPKYRKVRLWPSDGRHQQVQDGIPQICLDPIQNGQFKREHSYHLVSLVVSESSAGFRDDPQWLQYWSPGLQSVPQEGQVT